MPKKKWSITVLTVLVRGKPEEIVLSACKSGGSESSSNSWATNCSDGVGMPPSCSNCRLTNSS